MRYRVAWTKTITEQHVVYLDAEAGLAAVALAKAMPEDATRLNAVASVSEAVFRAIPDETETKALAAEAHIQSGGRVNVDEAVGWVKEGIIRPEEPR